MNVHSPLAGQVALVSGGSRGIGRAIALKLASAGADVAIVFHTGQEEAESTVGALQALGRRAVALQADVSDPESVAEAFTEFRKTFSRLDIVVSNAATGVLRPVLELNAKHWRRCMDTNALALHTLAREAAPLMPNGGCMIGMSSMGSNRAIPHYAFIGASKAALEALVRSLAQELGPRGIRVNTVFPGPIESPRIRTVFAAMDGLRKVAAGPTAEDFLGLMTLSRNPALARIAAAADGAPAVDAPTEAVAPSKGFPTVSDVANTIVFLASDESAALNGHNFEVTHGMTVRQESRSTWVSRPELRTVDGTGLRVLVAAGDQVTDALAVARVQATCGAEVRLTLGSEESVRAAEDALGLDAVDQRIRV